MSSFGKLSSCIQTTSIIPGEWHHPDDFCPRGTDLIRGLSSSGGMVSSRDFRHPGNWRHASGGLTPFQGNGVIQMIFILGGLTSSGDCRHPGEWCHPGIFVIQGTGVMHPGDWHHSREIASSGGFSSSRDWRHLGIAIIRGTGVIYSDFPRLPVSNRRRPINS